MARKPKHDMPDNWYPTKEMLERAEAKYPRVDLKEFTDMFIEKSGEYEYSSWNGAWWTWLRAPFEKPLKDPKVRQCELLALEVGVTLGEGWQERKGVDYTLMYLKRRQAEKESNVVRLVSRGS